MSRPRPPPCWRACRNHSTECRSGSSRPGRCTHFASRYGPVTRPRPSLVAQRNSARPRAPTGVITRLSGWGANARADCRLYEPEDPAQLAAWLDRTGSIARGLGRSYGDAAVNAGGQVLGMTRVDRYLAFDDATGTLTCEAGASLEQILRHFVPRGWFPMITPGTKFVT